MNQNFAVRRITTELTEQDRNPSLYFVAHPIEDDLFDWHFTLKGPDETSFQGGLYHGRLILPLEYPLKPPKFLMYTVSSMQPNGRFETMREICVSMSSFHPSDWQPAWTSKA
jgi:ubiquitin-conjugating enzyme E2 J1